MDDKPISKTLDNDTEPYPQPSFSSTDPLDADSSSRSLVWLILGVAAIGCGLLVAVAVYFFRPDMQAAYNQYFPSPTSTATPTPNMTATQRVVQITSTSQAKETLVADSSSQWDIVIRDPFDNVGNNWITGTDQDSYATILRRGVDRTYQWDATSKKGFISWITAYDKPLKDFYLSVEAERISGSTASDYGLIFREDAGGNFYYFGVGDEGFFVSVLHEDEWINVVDFTYSSVIIAGEKNRLTVIGRRSYFIFLINDVIVAEAVDDHIPSGTTALAIQIHEPELQATFEFDNFELRAPQ